MFEYLKQKEMKNILLESEILTSDSYLQEFYYRIKKNLETNPTAKAKEDEEKFLTLFLAFRRMKVELDYTRKKLNQSELAFHKVYEEKNTLEYQNEMFKKSIEV